MKQFMAIILTLSTFFISQIGFAKESVTGKDIVKGEISQINSDDNSIWIKTNQALVLKNGSVLYVHNSDDDVKAILKVSEIKPRFVKGKFIDGAPGDVQVGDKVNNIYQWDSYEYLASITYEKGARKIVSVDHMMIDRALSVTSEGEKQDIDGREIKTIKVGLAGGSLNAKEITFKDGRSIKVNKDSITALDKLEQKQVQLDVPGVGVVTLSAGDITSIELTKRLKGAKKVVHLHHTRGESALPQGSGDTYKVTFRFLNYELGREALEEKIAAEGDKEKVNELVKNLKLYSKKSVDKVGVAGSFNDWDDTKNEMTKNDDDIYETTITLPKGKHHYYFVITFTGSERMSLKVNDPYSNKLDEVEGKGKVSLIDVPGVNFAGGSKGVSEATGKGLPYDPDELKVEEDALSTNVQVGESVMIGNICYYKVVFKFDQIKRVRTDIKRAINRESVKANPNKEKMKKWQEYLRLFNEDSVEVSIVGSFNEWKPGAHKMEDKENGMLEKTIYIEKGKYQYKYAIVSPVAGTYLMHDPSAKTEDTVANDEGDPIGVIYVATEREPKEEPKPAEEEKEDEEEEEDDEFLDDEEEEDEELEDEEGQPAADPSREEVVGDDEEDDDIEDEIK